jgi:hypothetical protein
MCLDYNRVSGKLRVMVLEDEEYRRETRNIYAKQRLDELREIDSLAKLALEEHKDDEEENDPRNRGKKKRTHGMDKDKLAMRFKAAQMRRELVASLNDDNAASERDMANFLFVSVTREEIEKNIRCELNEGDTDDGLDALTGVKEEAPEGSNGKIRGAGKTSPLNAEDFFETLPDGTVVEK